MKKVTNSIIAYGMWFVDIALAFWLFYFSRTAYLGIFALFYKTGNSGYANMVSFLDKAFMIVLGLTWLTFMIIVEEYFRLGIQKGTLVNRFAKITGPVLLCIFVVDLIVFWLEGIGSGNWLRWLILAGELGIGIALVVFAKSASLSKTS